MDEMLKDLSAQIEYFKTIQRDAEVAAESFEKRNIGTDQVSAAFYRGKAKAYKDSIEWLEMFYNDYKGDHNVSSI